MSRALAEFLGKQISEGKTLLISGGTGTGKTTLLRILADFIPGHERIVVIEDTPELHIRKSNIVAAGSQTNTFKSHVSFDDLVKDALRFRPDRIILGEVRGVEARTLLDSFNTGHSGSLATIQANSARKALCRFANPVMRSHAQTTFSDTDKLNPHYYAHRTLGIATAVRWVRDGVDRESVIEGLKEHDSDLPTDRAAEMAATASRFVQRTRILHSKEN